MAEVQVFDGDGVVTPEIRQLMAENENLHDRVSSLKSQAIMDAREIESLHREIGMLREKFAAIYGIIMEKPKDKYEDPQLEDEYDNHTIQPDDHRIGLDPKRASLTSKDIQWGYNHHA